jgi:hypothetical protein
VDSLISLCIPARTMKFPVLLTCISSVLGLLAFAGSLIRAAEPAPATPAPLKDSRGHTLRRAPTGHITNYDEDKVPPYVLPDPLALQNGQPVRDADAWFKERRPEILQLYTTQVFGRVPENVPKVTYKVVETDPAAMGGRAVRRLVAVHFGDKPDGPVVQVHLYLPAKATAPVPVLLHLVFFGNPPIPGGPPPQPPPAGFPRGINEAGPIAEILARGYGYATFRYTEVQPDKPNTFQSGVIGLALAPGATKPAADEWGTISAWAWGASRVLDYFATDSSIDARRVALIGHSRLGKTVLWAGAQDQRFALAYSSCAGEMGSALSRRDYGETIDDMASNFGYQFAGNFQKYAGHWTDLSVDAHLLIALHAPRPVFITAGTEDVWSDPRGEFLAEVAAGPVYRLLGRKDLGTTELRLDTPLIAGDLGFHEHTGGHTMPAADWNAFLDFADKYLRSAR